MVDFHSWFQRLSQWLIGPIVLGLRKGRTVQWSEHGAEAARPMVLRKQGEERTGNKTHLSSV